jgi:hypothetical protein
LDSFEEKSVETTEASPAYVLGAIFVCKELIACGPGKFPLVLQFPSVCLQGQQSSKPQIMPKWSRKQGERIALNSALAGGEPRDLVPLTASLSAYTSHPTAYLPVKGRRLWKSCDLEDLGLGSSDHPGN